VSTPETIVENAKLRFSEMTGKAVPSHSFEFGESNGSSNDRFKITWTPGVVVMSGDRGTLVIEHYTAMNTFKEAMSWLSTSHWDYLLGKSDAKKVIDFEKTHHAIIKMANEEIAYYNNQPGYVFKPGDFGTWEAIAKAVYDIDISSKEDRDAISEALLHDLKWSLHHEKMDIIYKIGIDDFHGVEEYEQETIWQITCLQEAAKEILKLTLKTEAKAPAQ
jgi:hypothetical protein